MLDNIKKLTVKYNGRIVGYVADIDGRISFQYDESWLKTGFTISPLSLPLSPAVYTNKKTLFSGLYGVFNDSLPDGWGELLVRRMLYKRGVDYDRLSPLTRLAIVSEKGLGALSYEPTFPQEDVQTISDLDYLAEEARKVLTDSASDLDAIFAAGGSSGGARPKAHVTINGEEWIIKFPASVDLANIGETEYRANVLARRCGINVNEFKAFPSRRYKSFFGAKRFDRIDGRKVHVISLAAVLETTHRIPNMDYTHLFQVVERICVDQKDREEAFRRMSFNVIFGNRDDHSKNFAFIFDEKKGGYTLSPFYDITPTPYKPEHEMTVNGNGKPTEDDLLAVGKRAKLSLPKMKLIIEEIKDICS